LGAGKNRNAEVFDPGFVEEDKAAILELASLWNPSISVRQNDACMKRA
jgi:hypothetical protein